MDVHFQPRPRHPDGIPEVTLRVYKILLLLDVKSLAVGRERDALRGLDDLGHVLLGNFAGVLTGLP